MSNVEYSFAAVNVLNAFHRCEKLIYVEGEDDVLFWDTMFKYLGYDNYKIEAKDGCGELDKYIERLDSEELNIIIARDSDYKSIAGNFPVHDRIIGTFGYSIENTLFVPEAVHNIARIQVKSPEFNHDYDSWLIDFCVKIECLLQLDVANFNYSCSVDVLNDNCTRYMKTKACCELDLAKIQERYIALSPEFTAAQKAGSSSKINNSSKCVSEIIRGHFFQSAVLKYISSCVKATGKKSGLSHDHLYSSGIQYLSHKFGPEHRHFEYYKSSIDKAMNAA